ncbi:hypothetical protein [Alteromonas halophila]|uniref:Uncharacterized protein n=1 Tax=Alteromonas halophila TaxID=516698 RepID=A0A918MUM6_9ALTE|nr:hypothetical protein [Alteromonas halophila]GGW76437.1 hypothetical protein GCM10007391_06330 [Alteromonas halophila]
MKKILIIFLVVGIAIGGRLLYLSQQPSESQTAPPVITVMDILHASDFQAGIKKAVKESNDSALKSWMDKAQHVGSEAGLSDEDLDWLKSEQARDYAVFNAKRALFNEAFEKRFVALEGIEDVKNAYPEAKNLFPKADSLIEKRDKIIYSIAQTLAEGNTPTEQDLADARDVWQQRYADSASDTLTPAGDS